MEPRARARLKLTNDMRITNRRVQASELYLQGYNIEEIANKLQTTATTIQGDLVAVREQWMETMGLNYDSLLMRELAKIDLVIKEAWKGWYESCKDALIIKRVKEQVPVEKRFDKKTGKLVDLTPEEIKATPLKVIKDIVEEQRKGQSGNAQFLKIILDALNQRQLLLGLRDDEKRSDSNTKTDRFDWKELVNPPRQVDVIQEAINSLPEQK
jgi:predicted transcriptional regulator